MADRQALLESVLESPAQQDAFVEFCKKNHCAENLLFYRSICEFEEAATDEERLTKVSEWKRALIIYFPNNRRL